MLFSTLQELRLLRVQQTGNVNVEVDSSESVDLLKTLQDIREYYETMVVKNKQDVEKWFQDKVRWEGLKMSMKVWWELLKYLICLCVCVFVFVFV